ncbi:glycosyltransferase [Motilimonas sp. E26]|uniref:glycosyltransferase n=1 Tax=Motilimonas sp. E26 TaxID=2865674 RepID=UPI001E3C2027|nr:glycosyltransferase [Motilimonas sp. E26]MCE0558861.1 glycosyltransferase [Motilimonas sp. E26]
MTRHILHIHDQALPPTPSCGGSNRLIDWLASAQSQLGCKVTALSPRGASNSSYQHVTCDVKNIDFDTLIKAIPQDVTDIEYHGGLSDELAYALQQRFNKFVSVVHAGAANTPNCVYVSKSHAQQANAEVYVHNGIPVESVEFNGKKSNFSLFLAKVKRSKKGVVQAINIAKKTNQSLIVAGGHRFGSPETWFAWHSKIKPVGYVDGQKKRDLLKNAKALWVPINWEEPFGLTVVEAMMSGTPVIAYNRGAMSELIIDGVTGFVCNNEADFIAAIDKTASLDPQTIRQHALSHFSAEKMASAHLDLLEKAAHSSW